MCFHLTTLETIDIWNIRITGLQCLNKLTRTNKYREFMKRLRFLFIIKQDRALFISTISQNNTTGSCLLFIHDGTTSLTYNNFGQSLRQLGFSPKLSDHTSLLSKHWTSDSYNFQCQMMFLTAGTKIKLSKTTCTS